jgi:hypothetical protein
VIIEVGTGQPRHHSKSVGTFLFEEIDMATIILSTLVNGLSTIVQEDGGKEVRTFDLHAAAISEEDASEVKVVGDPPYYMEELQFITDGQYRPSDFQ